MQITPLAPEVSDRIRAATAVPTFSRALEELVFNSLDAGATEIVASVNVQALSLSVRDNGRGMDRLALSVVGTSAATSKIRSLEELRGGVHTFGFRGEALHALSTVALVEIVSRCVDPPAAPSLVTVLQHGQRTQPGPAAEARAPGTTVSVRNMFSNRAVARKRHQRPSAAGAELSLLVARMTRLAVASPGVAFRLHDASRGVTLVTKGRAASPLAAFRQLLLCGSHEEQPRLAELSFDDGRYSLHGHLSVLCNGGRIRDAQLLSLNGRPLERTSELHRLIEASYARLHRRLAGQMSSPGSAPAVFCISLTCCPSRYDAAFHKEKSEVMFYDLAAVRNALLGALTSFFCREASALDPRDIAAELVCLAAGARDASDDAPREVRDGTHGERRDEAVDEAVDETEGEGGGLVGATSYEAEPGARGSDHGQSASVEADRHELREAGRAGYELQEDRSTGGARASLARARHHPAVLLAALESPATPPPPSPLECQPPARKVDHERQQRQPLATPPPLGPSSSGNWLSSPRPSAAGRSKRPLDEAPKEEWLGQEGRWEGQEAGREAGQGGGRDGVGPSLGGAVHAAEGPAPGLLAGAHGLPHPAPAHTAAQDGGDGLFGGEGDEAGIARGLVSAAFGNLVDSRPSRRRPVRRGLPFHQRLSAAPSLAAAPEPTESRITKDDLSRLVAIGQIDRRFVAACIPPRDGGGARLCLVDQHAADERVQLELLQARTISPQGGPLPGAVARRRLHPPRAVALPSHEGAALSQAAPSARAWGWELEGVGVGDTHLRAVPVLLGVELGDGALLEYLRLIAETGCPAQPPPQVHRILASKACRRAIMFGDMLDATQCQALLTKLAGCAMPFFCAHGRPSIAPMLQLPTADSPPRMLVRDRND